MVLTCLALVSIGPGCPGELPSRADRGNVILDNSSRDTSIKAQDTLTFNTDAVLDTGPSPDGSKADTKPAVDLSPAKPDKGNGTVGGKCPCAAPLLCVDNKYCRAQCKAPTGGCKAVSNCPTDHACIDTDVKNVYVCLPGVAAGKSCSQYVPCYNKHICAAINYKPSICVPVCSSAGGKCGKSSKGTCLKSGTCLFCSSP